MSTSSPDSQGGSSLTDSLVIMEVLQRFRVGDVMSPIGNLISVTRADTIRQAKELMHEHGVSGLPVLENGRLFGIISTNRVIRAMDEGTLDQRCDQQMTTGLVVLKSEMPLTFALRAFQSYTFGRFPVLDSQNAFVGIITPRDIMRALLGELTHEIARLEQKAGAGEIALPRYSMRQFAVIKDDFTNAGKATSEIKRSLQAIRVDPKLIRRISVAAYELEINICIHSLGGTLTFIWDDHKVMILAEDHGPGIPDIDWALQEGTSTATDWVRSMGFGAGMGLVNSKRVSDEFKIHSSVPKGTTIECVFNV